MTLAVVTTVAGRADHLAVQRRALADTLRPGDEHLVVLMDDDPLAAAVTADDIVPTRVRRHPAPAPDRLPLAAARNTGLRAAAEAGHDVVVLLDVDCVPSPTLVSRYADVVATRRRPTIASGTVGYLPPPPAGGYPIDRLDDLARPHPARPDPAADLVIDDASHDLFWSLSCAATTATWGLVGGFCEAYEGYGGEDTDLGQVARQRGVAHVWVGGAAAYHQHHGSQDPPVQHLDAILANARVFHARWGRWPMEGWLEAFADLGLVVRSTDGTPTRAPGSADDIAPTVAPIA